LTIFRLVLLIMVTALFPADLRAARKALGLTQHALAEALGMGRWGWQTISAWEGGRSPVPKDLPAKLEKLRPAARQLNERNDR
jgi:transcriptional regulator with XRE-family HTH domain